MNAAAGAMESERDLISTAESTLTFDARTTLHAVHGTVSGLQGFVEGVWGADGWMLLDPMPKMSVNFAVEQLRSGNAMIDREMRKLIDNARFPRISAELRSLRAGTSLGRYVATGDVTLAGRTKRYDGDIVLLHDGEKVTLDGDLEVDIRDFGLKPPNLLVMKAEPMVKVRIHMVARRPS